jgi:lycopene cyclase domain-containing protein
VEPAVRDYTTAAGLAVVAVVAVELLWLRTGIFTTMTFWMAYSIIVVFQFLVDGWLTKLSSPIVVYNADEITGWRLPFDIPFEDFLFGFALVTLPILLWEWAGRRRAGEDEEASDRGGTAPNPPR